MTQEAIIRTLQNGSLTSYDIENLTGIPRTSIVAACKKMIRKKQISVEKIKDGRSWIMRYTLEPHMIEATKAANDAPLDKLNPFDIRNAQGIFSKAEYAVMNSQARRLLGNPDFTKDITNYQTI
jgi:DNA-binding MarR family transcriptional regulator